MNLYKKLSALVAVAVLTVTAASAQEFLTLEEAVRIGLEKNYAIEIARRNVELAQNNVTLGNAGFLPTVDARATRTFDNRDSRQEFETNPAREVSGARSNSLNSSLNFNWTIFDGMGMFVNLDRLRTLKISEELLTKATVETTVADISNAYYEVVRQAKKIQPLIDAVSLSAERVELIREQYRVGVAAKVAILTAEVDYNADRTELLRQQENLKTAQINLNQLLARDPDLEFNVIDTIQVITSLELNESRIQALNQNPALLRARVNQELAVLDLRSAQASRFPVLGVTSAYVFNRSESEPLNPFSPISNQSKGFNYGLTLAVPLFNGFNRTRLAQNARILIETSRIALSQTQQLVESDVARAYSRYQNRLRILDLEESNIQLARQNAEVAMERYKLGLLTALELREAQRNQLVAENRLIDIQFEAKAAEIELRRLSSTLVIEGVAQ
ncbi:TolC family protein [Rufibacter roseus]|uniref:TolC family protein n=1 Tax=Rufibacter roseus TaxID=1567108 RepID=A0ABW2DJ12_9BACT|nr:TolC family protein [Rufibacter roseus]